MNNYKYWVEKLDLQPHPEGGFYKEVYRSTDSFENKENAFPSGRNYSTAIYYLLHSQNFSAFHKIKSDELWHFYAGNTAVIIHELEPKSGNYTKHVLGIQDKENPFVAIKAGNWFAAELLDKTLDKYVLCGCTVCPGFDFADFEMANKKQLTKSFQDYSNLIERLTIN